MNEEILMAEEEVQLIESPATELQVVESQNPREVVRDASEKSKVLKNIVDQSGLSHNFGGAKNHLDFEAWCTVARFYGSAPEVISSRPIFRDDKLFGYESRACLKDLKTGVQYACVESMTAVDEMNWKDKPEYAIRSMSETRAMSKACRTAYSFVAVLAGYSPTPAEEMARSFSSKPKAVNTPATNNFANSNIWWKEAVKDGKYHLSFMQNLAEKANITKEEVEAYCVQNCKNSKGPVSNPAFALKKDREIIIEKLESGSLKDPEPVVVEAGGEGDIPF